MELLEQHNVLVVVALGSILGSFKASLDDRKQQAICQRICNFLLGLYCGIAMGCTYKQNIDLGYIGLISLVSAMIGTNVLEVISDLSPDIVKKYIKGKFK